MSRSAWLRLGAVALVVAVLVVVQILVGLPSQDDLRGLLDGLGAWAVPAFMVTYVGVSLLPAGPSAVLTIVGGALLGFAVALPAVLVAAVLGSAAAFALVRLLGGDVVRHLGGVTGERVRDLDDRVRDHGFVTVLVARLIPMLPFTTLNYAFGLTSVRFGSYLLATGIGIAPGTAVYVAVGAYGLDPGSLPFLLAIGGLVLLSVVGYVRTRRSGGRGGEGPGEDDGPSTSTGEPLT